MSAPKIIINQSEVGRVRELLEDDIWREIAGPYLCRQYEDALVAVKQGIGLEPVDHDPVYKRIEIGRPVRPIETASTRTLGEAIFDAFQEAQAQEEFDRIWKITRQTAEGCNQPTRQIEPEPEIQQVDESGWEVA
jgi:hypothetical protein